MTQQKWPLAPLLPLVSAIHMGPFHHFCMEATAGQALDCRVNEGTFWGPSFLGEPFNGMEIMPQIFSCTFHFKGNS